MHKTVLTNFRRFNEPLEGVVSHMYLDIKGLVTVGVGFLIDPISEARRLPFRRKDNGQTATSEEISQEWNRVKADTSLARRGASAAAAVTQLELTSAAMDTEISRRLRAMESVLMQSSRIRGWFDLLPQAQMAVMSMCWAVGAAGVLKFERFVVAIQMEDFEAAARECAISTVGNPGIIKRNQKNVALLRNAAQAKLLML
jgi:GH24 family phage-related lysozyme (muramidase)